MHLACNFPAKQINIDFSTINDFILYKRRFTLGSRIHVNRYIQQFTEIFTEEGRKSVKITHQVQGHPPRVMYTHSMREKERLREKEEKQQQLIQQQLQQQPSVAQQLPVNKDATETQPTNATQPIPIKVYIRVYQERFVFKLFYVLKISIIRRRTIKHRVPLPKRPY